MPLIHFTPSLASYLSVWVGPAGEVAGGPGMGEDLHQMREYLGFAGVYFEEDSQMGAHLASEGRLS